jgi:hypothetical protein
MLIAFTEPSAVAPDRGVDLRIDSVITRWHLQMRTISLLDPQIATSWQEIRLSVNVVLSTRGVEASGATRARFCKN